MTPKTMQALVTVGDGTFVLKDVDVPELGPDEILVQVVAVAQNPTDWKTLWLHQKPGNILGCDFAGVVVEIGAAVPPGLRHVGERIAGLVHGGVGPNGSFAEYVVAPAELAISLPDALSFEEAAQVSLPCYTTCQGLYQHLHLPMPFASTATPNIPEVLIWSGTSSTGQFAIQFAKLAGLRVVSTASPQQFDFVRALGADEVFDYADSFTPRKIVAATGGRLKFALDCISQDMTPNQVSMSLSADGGTIATLHPYESRRNGVRTESVLAYTVFGKSIEFPYRVPAQSEHHKNAVEYSKLISELLEKDMLKTCPIKILPHGLASVADGFEYMKAGKVHAEKLIYRITDTPGLSR